MFAKKYLLTVLLAFALVLAWKYQASGALSRLGKADTPAPTIKFDNDSPPSAGNAQADGEPTQQVSRKATSGIHKCKVGGSVIYTDAPCEKPGSEQALGGGSVTVVKGQRPSASPASDTGSQPNVRDMLVGRPNPNEPSLKDQQMDRVIGR